MERLILIVLLAIIIKFLNCVPLDKWHETENLKFFINPQYKYNWYESLNECALRNMSLIAVDTQEKHMSLLKVLRKTFGATPNLWMGGTDLGETGKYVWSSTGKEFEFTNWSRGNPNNLGGIEHCVQIFNKSDFEWNDEKCHWKFGYICEENRFVLNARKDLAIKKHFIDELFEL